MSTYRERKEARAERLREWAAKRKQKSAAAFNTARTIADSIPLGQPILVGHHSEKRHRRDLARIDSGMRNGVEHQKMAKSMESRAANIEDALECAIYDDDPDAIERLEEKAKALEAKRDQMKAVNAAFKKGDEALRALGVDPEKLRAELARLGPYFGSKPFLPYSFQNIGATIRKARERKGIIKAKRARQAEVEAAPGGVVFTDHGNNWCSVQFAEKPERAILTALKDAGFQWSSARWVGYLDKLPPVVRELVTP